MSNFLKRKYRVIGCTSRHGFPLGTIVTHTKKPKGSCHNNWYTSDGSVENTWGLCPWEIERVRDVGK
jgi:hypothetical protein